jgi:hypothetical protein
LLWSVLLTISAIPARQVTLCEIVAAVERGASVTIFDSGADA